MTRAGWRREHLNVILMSEHVPLVVPNLLLLQLKQQQLLLELLLLRL